MSNTIITLVDGRTIETSSVHLNTSCTLVFVANTGRTYDAYDLQNIQSIIPPKEKAPTYLQSQLTTVLQEKNYKWDKQHSTAAAGVVLKRSQYDFWFFGMQGEIMHNPNGISIRLKPGYSNEERKDTYNDMPDYGDCETPDTL